MNIGALAVIAVGGLVYFGAVGNIVCSLSGTAPAWGKRLKYMFVGYCLACVLCGVLYLTTDFGSELFSRTISPSLTERLSTGASGESIVFDGVTFIFVTAFIMPIGLWMYLLAFGVKKAGKAVAGCGGESSRGMPTRVFECAKCGKEVMWTLANDKTWINPDHPHNCG